MSDTKQCPFCGASTYATFFQAAKLSCTVECGNHLCQAHGPLVHLDMEKQGHKKWNVFLEPYLQEAKEKWNAMAQPLAITDDDSNIGC